MPQPAEKPRPRKHPASRGPLTTTEFDEVMAANESILELSPADLDPMLYSYNQTKQLLLRFNLPFTTGMKKKTMIAKLIALRAEAIEAEAAQANASTSASTTGNQSQRDNDAEEAAQLEIVAQQVEESNAEEAGMEPTVDIDQIRAEHGTEIAELDAKIQQLEQELRGDIATASAAAVKDFKQTDFKAGMTNVNLRITRNELQLQSVAETLDHRFPDGDTKFTSLLVSPVETATGAPNPTTEATNMASGETRPTVGTFTANKHPRELFYGYEHKDGRRTCCPARKEAEDDRLRRNGFIMVQYSYSQDEILQWMTRSLKHPPELTSPTHRRGGGSLNTGGEAGLLNTGGGSRFVEYWGGSQGI